MAGDHANPARAVDGQHGGLRVAAGTSICAGIHADDGRLAATGADRRALTGLVTDKRNQEELADRVVAVTTVTGKYLDSQRLRFVSSDDGSRT
jgi:hypothetical protein